MNDPVSLEFPYPPPRPWPVFPATLPRRGLWVFGYGSLLWNPGFPYREAVVGRLYGYHRDLCVWSRHYRGNSERPGLVLGLDRGGSCTGVSYRVADADRQAVLAYLQQRELFTDIYHPVSRPIVLAGGRRIRALCFVVDRAHGQYTGRLSLQEVTRIVGRARGRRGANTDYVLNTLAHLEELGFPCRRLRQVVKGLERTPARRG